VHGRLRATGSRVHGEAADDRGGIPEAHHLQGYCRIINFT
jgi:hypothetical protein